MPSFIILGYVRQILGRGLFAASKRLILNRVQAWLEKGSNLKTVYCRLCHHSFDVSNMGRNFLPILFFNANNTELPNLVSSTPPKWSNGKSSSTVSLLPSDVQLKKQHILLFIHVQNWPTDTVCPAKWHFNAMEIIYLISNTCSFKKIPS